MAYQTVERTPYDALRKLLRLSPANQTDMSGMSQEQLGAEADPRLAGFEPSEQDLIDAQGARVDAAQKDISTQTGRPKPYAVSSRESIRDQGMTKVRQLLGMGDIEHKRAMEEAALKEAGLNKRAEMQHQSEARPYYTPLNTAEGVQSFDTRTGKIAGRLGDYKPSATAEEALTNAQGVQSDIRRMKQLYNPAVLGPIAGRYKTVEQALIGQDPSTTDLFQTAQRLHNTVVYLRTGKQMNESEAGRILAEIPNKNDPPDVFAHKLQGIGDYFDQWVSNRSKLAFGRTTTEDVNRLTGGGGGGTAVEFVRDASGRLVRKGR
jgi:hypothetical protein